MTGPTELIVAVDVPTLPAAAALLDRLGEAAPWCKVGKELFTAAGPDAIRLLKDHGKRVFLDLKYHDIPNTVAGAVKAALALGVDMLNVHAGGGPEMLRAAAAAKEANPYAYLLAVTVLTSMDDEALHAVGVRAGAATQVSRLARLAWACGLDGVVASAREIRLIRRACGADFTLVIPGIRPAGAAMGDQKRVMTPAAAAAAGADFIVVGRPVTQASDPAAAATAIEAELAAG